MEDCYHLVRLLSRLAQPFTTSSLVSAFEEYTRVRLPIAQMAVSQAKKEGENKTLKGEEACKARDERMMLSGGMNKETMEARLKLLRGPFEGESEI